MAVTSSGSITLPHSCPCKYYGCSTTAENYPDLDKFFGFRTINGPNGKKIRSQSWCRECRKTALREKKELD